MGGSCVRHDDGNRGSDDDGDDDDGNDGDDEDDARWRVHKFR